ncbi:hypothetical protein Hanom_Chr12g01094301 [Helianthus anomalus]
MAKKTLRSPEVPEFSDPEILKPTEEELCTFDNQTVTSQFLPGSAVIRPFDSHIKVDLNSETWVCFPFSPSPSVSLSHSHY